MTKFLNISTDNTLGGNSPSDVTVSSQKAIKEYVDNNSGGAVDNSTINKNSSNQLQAIGLINKNTANGATNPKYDWVGTLQQYNDQAVATNHPDWVCYITDDISGGESVYTKAETNSEIATAISTMLSSVYPVGAVYIGTTSTCPIASLISGSVWTLKSSAIVTSVDTNVPINGNGMSLGLTNGTQLGGLNPWSGSGGNVMNVSTAKYDVAIGITGGGTAFSDGKAVGVTTDASKSGIVGTVTRSAYTVNIWERTA